MKQIESSTIIETMPLINTRKTSLINTFFKWGKNKEMAPMIPSKYKLNQMIII